jgi:hypothetical protein
LIQFHNATNKIDGSDLVLLHDACGALLFSFFAPDVVSLIGTGRPQKKKQKKGIANQYTT